MSETASFGFSFRFSLNWMLSFSYGFGTRRAIIVSVTAETGKSSFGRTLNIIIIIIIAIIITGCL